MADSSATPSNGSSKLVVILLVLNLLATIAMLGHVFYYIPGNGDGGTSDSAEPEFVTELLVDGVGNIGMSPRGIVLEMIELNQNNPNGQPKVMQTVTMSQEAFLNTLGRMSLLRERLVEKDLVREVE